MTVVYRLVKAERAESALSGEGARRYGGRWNPPGTAVVYASESRALAVLETFVHLTLEARSMHFVLYEVTLPRRALFKRHGGVRPPRALESSQEIGRGWLDEGSSLALIVPSVIVPEETNYVLNVGHAQFARLKISPPAPFSFDERLWQTHFA